jgi:hypothetical protein
MTMPNNMQTRRARQAARATRDAEALDSLARLLSASPRLGDEELIAAFRDIVGKARPATAPEQEN